MKKCLNDCKRYNSNVFFKNFLENEGGKEKDSGAEYVSKILGGVSRKTNHFFYLRKYIFGPLT